VACNGISKDHINLQDQSYGEKLVVAPRKVRGGRSGRGERSIFSSDPRSCLDLMNETFVRGSNKKKGMNSTFDETTYS
jgi:hypothetical protein